VFAHSLSSLFRSRLLLVILKSLSLVPAEICCSTIFTPMTLLPFDTYLEMISSLRIFSKRAYLVRTIAKSYSRSERSSPASMNSCSLIFLFSSTTFYDLSNFLSSSWFLLAYFLFSSLLFISRPALLLLLAWTWESSAPLASLSFLAIFSLYSPYALLNTSLVFSSVSSS